jgi:hypothetical protein
MKINYSKYSSGGSAGNEQLLDWLVVRQKKLAVELFDPSK